MTLRLRIWLRREHRHRRNPASPQRGAGRGHPPTPHQPPAVSQPAPKEQWLGLGPVSLHVRRCKNGTCLEAALFPCEKKVRGKQKLLQYHSVLQSAPGPPVPLQSTTPCYSVLKSSTPVLLGTTPVMLCATKYYSVLHRITPYYSILQSITPCYFECSSTSR